MRSVDDGSRRAGAAKADSEGNEKRPQAVAQGRLVSGLARLAPPLPGERPGGVQGRDRGRLATLGRLAGADDEQAGAFQGFKQHDDGPKGRRIGRLDGRARRWRWKRGPRRQGLDAPPFKTGDLGRALRPQLGGPRRTDWPAGFVREGNGRDGFQRRVGGVHRRVGLGDGPDRGEAFGLLRDLFAKFTRRGRAPADPAAPSPEAAGR